MPDDKKTTPTKAKSEKETLHDRIVEILKEHNNEESNIGMTHEYWEILRRFRSL